METIRRGLIQVMTQTKKVLILLNLVLDIMGRESG